MLFGNIERKCGGNSLDNTKFLKVKVHRFLFAWCEESFELKRSGLCNSLLLQKEHDPLKLKLNMTQGFQVCENSL